MHTCWLYSSTQDFETSVRLYAMYDQVFTELLFAIFDGVGLAAGC